MIFTDVRLPGTRSGLDLALVVQRDFPTAKVLLTSGVIREEEVNVSGVTFVRKPYFLFDVERQIKALVNA